MQREAKGVWLSVAHGQVVCLKRLQMRSRDKDDGHVGHGHLTTRFLDIDGHELTLRQRAQVNSVRVECVPSKESARLTDGVV